MPLNYRLTLQIYSRKLVTVLILYSLMLNIVSCQMRSHPLAQVPLENSEGLSFELKLGSSPELKYSSSIYSKIKEYKNDQLTRERTERTDFEVASQGVLAPKDQVWIKLKTLNKEGPQDLHELGLPELGQEMLFKLSPNARVLEVEGQPLGSFFYIPPIPLPEAGAVKKGSTWVRRFQWVNQRAGIPLELEVVGILKDFVDCADQSPCALLEISGAVGVLGQPSVVARFESEFQGEVLFSIKLGDVMWSLVKGREQMILPEEASDIKSCSSSELVEISGIRLDSKSSLTCL